MKNYTDVKYVNVLNVKITKLNNQIKKLMHTNKSLHEENEKIRADILFLYLT